MRRIMLHCVIIVALAGLAIACSGGGGGTAATAGGSGTATGTFTKEVAFTTGFDYWGGDDESRIMNLYLADDIHGSGWITSISVRHHLALASSATCPGMIIRMGHTASVNLVSTFADNVNNGKGSFQTVFNGTVSVPAGGTDAYYSIPLSQPFYYNGVDNLVVDFTYLSSCSASAGIVAHNTSYNANVFADGSGSSTALTGDVLTQVTDMKFHFSGGDDYFVPTTGVATPNTWPFNINPLAGRKVQMLYTKDEINGSGPITGIGFPVASVTSAQQYTVTIRLGHSALTALGTTFADNFSSTPVTVANNAVFTVPAGVPTGGFVWLPLPNGAFTYNGTDSLVMEIEVIDNGSATGEVDWLINTAYGRSVKLGGNLGASTGSVNQYAHYTKFRFAGGTVDVITAENIYLTFPYGMLANKQQFLYRAAELGAKGSISRLAYRLRSDSVASTYGNFELVLGDTTNTTLGDTSFSGNMTNAQTVYSGTYTIPAGLKTGDWVEIPLSTPFAYDGVGNLVVQTSNLAGSVNHIFVESNATRYPNRRAYRSNNTGDDPNDRDEILADLRLWIQ